MRRRAVRTRITVLATGVTIVVLAVVGVLVVLAVEVQLRANLDRTLEQRADQIEIITQDGTDPVILNSDAEDRFAQVLDSSGEVVAATGNVAGQAALAVVPSGVQDVADRSDLPLEDDAYRVLIRRFDLGEEAHYVVVGENIDDMQDGVRAVAITLAVVFPVVAALIGAINWWFVGRTLRPVEDITSEVAGIGLRELDHRVPTSGTGDEIDRLATTMNGMLARLEASASQQRRFVADASHELRTPLTRMRTLLEVDLSPASTHTVDYRSTATDALADVTEMQHLLDDLLFLARVDAGRALGPHHDLDLDVVVEAEVAALRPSASVPIEIAVLEPLQVHGDDLQLARVCRNLLANALRHAASQIVVSLTARGARVLLAVEDDGPGVPPSDRERVFDRFVRLQEARTAEDGSTGLGLAIVADIVALHGGDVSVTDGRLGGARFEVALPAAQSTVE